MTELEGEFAGKHRLPLPPVFISTYPCLMLQ